MDHKFTLEYDFGKKRVHFIRKMKMEQTEFKRISIQYILVHSRSTIFFHPCRDAFCAIEIITTIIKLLNNLLIVRERIIIG